MNITLLFIAFVLLNLYSSCVSLSFHLQCWKSDASTLELKGRRCNVRKHYALKTRVVEMKCSIFHVIQSDFCSRVAFVFHGAIDSCSHLVHSLVQSEMDTNQFVISEVKLN